MTLKFTKFAASQVGKYSCVKQCGVVCTVDIDTGNPVLNLNQQLATGLLGSSSGYNLTYFVSGIPSPGTENVTWTHNGELLMDTNEFVVMETLNGIFISPPITLAHEGKYTATVTTSAGNGSDSFHLNLESYPWAKLSVDCNSCQSYVQSNVESFIVDLESIVTITCNDTSPLAESNQSNMFSWKKDEHFLVSEGTVSITNISSSVSVLTVVDMGPSDGGWYECIIANDFGSNSTMVHISVDDQLHDSPLIVVGLSEKNVSWVSGCNASLLVRLEYGFPDLNATWSRQRTGSSHIEEIVADGNHFLLSGDHRLNLTIVDVVESDSGSYYLNVTSTDANTSDGVWFQVSVLVPPRLEPITESPLVLPTGSNVTIEVAIFDALPPVVESDITWIPSGGMEMFNGSQASVTLKGTFPGNPSEVTVAVNHPASNKSHTFQLTILDPPRAPVKFTVVAAPEKVCKAIFTWQATALVNMTIAATDSIGLELSPTGVDQWQKFGDQLYPVNESVMADLLPETTYHFRAYSWNNLVGRGETTEQTTFSTISNYFPHVVSLAVMGVSSSNISISWGSPQSHSDCYSLTGYLVTCQDLEDGDIVNTTSVQAYPSLHSYSVVIPGLPPDRSFICSVQVIGEDSDGSPLQTVPASSGTGSTLPRAPPEPLAPSVANEQGSPNTITLDLSVLRDSLSPEVASHVWIAVIRLVSPTLPMTAADQLYPDASLFVNSPQSGSPMSSASDGFYQPYLVAELNVGNIPAVFAIGSDNRSSTSVRQMQTPETYNGPLNGSDYYTCFFRVFSSSSRLGRQYDVFTSSGYMTPRRPVLVDVQSTPTTVNTVGIVIGVAVAILMLAILILLVLIVFLCLRIRSKTTPTSNDPEYEIAFGTPRKEPLSTATNIAYRKGQEHQASVNPPLQNASGGVYEDI